MPVTVPAASPPPHAVSRLRAARLARSSKPFMARGGIKGERCPGCRLVPSHCMCALRPSVPTRAGICLLMADIEPLKPSNTGWLIADVVADTFAFGWARTETDPALLALLADPATIEHTLLAGATKARALATPFMGRLRQAVGLRDLRASETPVAEKSSKVARPLFKQYREGDGQFYFKLVDAHGLLLLQSLGFATPREAGQAIARIKTEGAAALAALGDQLAPLSPETRAQLDTALQALREGD